MLQLCLTQPPFRVPPTVGLRHPHGTKAPTTRVKEMHRQGAGKGALGREGRGGEGMEPTLDSSIVFMSRLRRSAASSFCCSSWRERKTEVGRYAPRSRSWRRKRSEADEPTLVVTCGRLPHGPRSSAGGSAVRRIVPPLPRPSPRQACARRGGAARKASWTARRQDRVQSEEGKRREGGGSGRGRKTTTTLNNNAWQRRTKAQTHRTIVAVACAEVSAELRTRGLLQHLRPAQGTERADLPRQRSEETKNA